MCSSTASTSNATLEGRKLVKFVELLVHDYLQSKGFTETGETFAAECSNCNRNRDGGSNHEQGNSEFSGCAKSAAGNEESPVDEAGSWYFIADKLALPVRTKTAVMSSINPIVRISYDKSSVVNR